MTQHRDPQGHCNTPYLGPQCDTSFAEHLGTSYRAFQITYAVLTLSLLVISFYQIYAINDYFKKKRKPMKTQTLVSRVSTVAALTQCVYALDPFGWDGLLNPAVEKEVRSITIALLFFLLFHIGYQYMKLSTTTLKRQSKLLENLYWMFQYSLLFVFVVLAAGEYFLGPSYLWASVKYILAALLFCIALYLNMVYGLRIMDFMQDMHTSILSSRLSAFSTRSSALNTSGRSIGENSAEGDVTTEDEDDELFVARLTTENAVQIEKRAQQIRRVRMYLLATLVITIVCIGLFIYEAEESIEREATFDDPDEIPDQADLARHASLALAQLAGFLFFVLYFGRPRDQDEIARTRVKRVKAKLKQQKENVSGLENLQQSLLSNADSNGDPPV